nr:hypothetical protein [Deltaproteobacteria bacterium]
RLAGDDGTIDGTGANCGADCDPDFALASLSGINFSSRRVILLGTDTCQGDNCPAQDPPMPVANPCLASTDASESPVGSEEYCRLSPLASVFAPALGFSTPVERESFEAMRPSPADATQQEAYHWYTSVVEIEGPGTAVRGDWTDGNAGSPSVVTLSVNETCAERLTAQGISWTEAELDTLCVGTWDDGGVLRPLKMAPSMVFAPTEGRLNSVAGSSCDPPNGPDTCCSSCDLQLGVSVERYGVDASGNRRSPNDGTAIACSGAADPLVECRDLILQVDRADEPYTYNYAWDGAATDWPLPWYDKIRETHPEDRPGSWVVQAGACSADDECGSGQDCIGTNANGQRCTTGADCQDRTCQAEWFGACEATAGGTTYCVDQRFDDQGAASCLVATADFGPATAGDRLAECDTNGNGTYTSDECCFAALGGGMGCDPFLQDNLDPVQRYDRHPDLEDEASCACAEGQPAACASAIDAWCEAPLGTGSDPGPDSAAGDYAVALVQRVGGVQWDEDESVVELRLATQGSVVRGNVETCAESRGLIGDRATADGWRANDAFFPELLEDHDLALCSGSTYRLRLAESDAAHHITSEAGGTLDGRSEHVFETSQFRIEPSSLFPSDNLTIGSCDDLSFRFSAQYDLGAVNLAKITVHEGAADGPRVAGGADCDPDATPAEIAAGTIPCLTTNVENYWIGEVAVSIDETVHGIVFVPGTTYAIVLPGLDDITQMSDATAYAGAFHDACGMPLVLGDTDEIRALSEMEFTIDQLCP